jgi:NADPH2:quinone reductase
MIFSAYVDTPERLRSLSSKLFQAIVEGSLDVEIGGTYLLEEASRAHADLEARLPGPFVLRC